VVLLDDLPYLHTAEMKEKFRKALGNHIQQCPHRTVWIYSQTKGGQHQPKELEALLDPAILYRSGSMTKILQIHPVTNAKMKKILQQVCKDNKVAMPDITMFQGDLRHALLSLQFSLSALPSDKRDIPLSPFHALGKLLYAKRVVSSDVASANHDVVAQRRPPLDFVPERVLEQSGMALQGSIYFLQGHAPDFFTDVDDMSRAFASYSDAAMFMHGDHRVSNSSFALLRITLI
jgi:cell cycle checkpoint protein